MPELTQEQLSIMTDAGIKKYNEIREQQQKDKENG
jgi:hypothetical protein